MGSVLFGSTAQFSNVLEFGHSTAARTKTPQADSTCIANFAAHNRRHKNRSAALIYIKFRMGNALHNLLPDIEDPADCTSASKHLQWRRDFNERSALPSAAKIAVMHNVPVIRRYEPRPILRAAHESRSIVNSSWGCDTPRRAYRPTETRRRYVLFRCHDFPILSHLTAPLRLRPALPEM